MSPRTVVNLYTNWAKRPHVSHIATEKNKIHVESFHNKSPTFFNQRLQELLQHKSTIRWIHKDLDCVEIVDCAVWYGCNAQIVTVNRKLHVHKIHFNSTAGCDLIYWPTIVQSLLLTLTDVFPTKWNMNRPGFWPDPMTDRSVLVTCGGSSCV